MKKTLLSALVLATIAGQSALATPSWLKVDGSVNVDVTGKDSADFDRNVRIRDAELRFEVIAREGVKMVIKAELERELQYLYDNEELRNSSDIDTDALLEEAFIQIDTDKFGMPRAVVTFGKQQMAFGQAFSKLAMNKDSLLYKLTREDEMVGVTVALPGNFMNIVDEVAVSYYETGRGDLEISDDRSVSIKMSKQLTSQVKATISALSKEQGAGEREERQSLGFIFQSEDGQLTAWAEGILTRHNAALANSDYGVTAGASMEVGPGAVVIETSAIENVAKEVALAYNLPVGGHLVLSPEVRMSRLDDGTEDTRVGISARIQAAKAAKAKSLNKG